MRKGFVALVVIFILCAVMILANNISPYDEADFAMGQVPAGGNKAPAVQYVEKENEIWVSIADAMDFLGGRMRQEKETLRVQYNGITAEMTLRQQTAQLNGYDVYLPAAPEEIDGVVYLPVHFFTELWYLDALWQEDTLQWVKSKQSKPVIVSDVWAGDAKKAYSLEIPVVLRLNDKPYEKQLNKIWRQDFEMVLDIYQIESETYSDTALMSEVHSVYTSADLISVSVLLQKDVGGPFYGLWTYNVDLNKQKQIQLKDLFVQNKMESALAPYFPQEIEAGQFDHMCFYITEDTLFLYPLEAMWQERTAQEPVQVPLAEVQAYIRYEIFS